MGASLGDLLQLVDNQLYLGQQILNVYYYRVTAILGLDNPYLEEINDRWTEGVLAEIQKVQIANLVHVSREWRNLTNGVDLFTDTTTYNGSLPATTGNPAPSFLSLGFLLQRESLATRNGYKRIGGIPDDAIAGNTWTGEPADIASIETALAADITVVGSPVCEPIIVKRPIVAPVASYVYSSIGSAQFRGIGTQNSRKAGRGV